MTEKKARQINTKAVFLCQSAIFDSWPNAARSRREKPGRHAFVSLQLVERKMMFGKSGRGLVRAAFMLLVTGALSDLVTGSATAELIATGTSIWPTS